MAQQRARARARAVKLVLVALLIAYFSIIHTGVPRVCCRPMQLLLLGAAGCCCLHSVLCETGPPRTNMQATATCCSASRGEPLT